MKNNNFLKGFTVIELIVVIAIIAVLATIVTTNVMVYVTKGKNAAIKGNMAQLATHGGTFLLNDDGNDNYIDFCDDPKTKEFTDKIDELNGAEFVACLSGEDSEDTWCTRVGLVTTITTEKNRPVFCIDSTGLKREDIDRDLNCYLSYNEDGSYSYRCQ